jgi:hypothetical protein
MSKEISNFVIPEKPSGRFVQHYINNTPFFRFSLNNDESHHDISERLMNDYQLAVNPSSLLNNPAGKGFYKILKNGIIELYGDSSRESVKPSPKHLIDLTPYIPEGTELKINEGFS